MYSEPFHLCFEYDIEWKQKRMDELAKRDVLADKLKSAHLRNRTGRLYAALKQGGEDNDGSNYHQWLPAEEEVITVERRSGIQRRIRGTRAPLAIALP